MRNPYFILLILFAVSLNAQIKLDSNKVPVVVREKMWQLHPRANHILWAYEDYKKNAVDYNREVEKTLCFEALFQDGSMGEVMQFDSTARNYKDNGDLTVDYSPHNVPQKAIDKVNELVPGKKDAFDWEYDYDVELDSAKYYAFVQLSDTNKIVYKCYFDSLWNYHNMTIDILGDTTLIPLHKVNNYIVKHYKKSELQVATINKDKNGNIVSIVVMLHLSWAHRDLRTLKFDGKGNLTGRPKKATSRHMIVDF